MKKDKNSKKTESYNPEITEADKKVLGDKSGNLHTDSGDDELLKNRKKSIDFAGGDLDVPGRTLPKNKSEGKLKDEENQMYSQGGPGNEDLESTTDHVK